MGGDHPRRPQPGAGPERHGDHGYRGEVVDRDLPARNLGHVGEPDLLELLDASPAASAVHQANQRDSQLVRKPFRVDGLAEDRGVGGAAANGEVVALHGHPAPVDPAVADHDVGRTEPGQLAAWLVLPDARDGPRLVERPRIEEQVDSLPDRQPAAGVLSLHALGPAQLAGHGLATAKLVDLRLPAHPASIFRA